MNAATQVSKYLSQTTRAAFQARANQENEEAPEPASPNVELLRRVQRIVFSPSVKTLQEASSRLQTLLEELDDNEKEAKKKNVPVE